MAMTLDIKKTKKMPPSIDREVAKGFMIAIKKVYDLDLDEVALVELNFPISLVK